jgi:SAM-dependent methyltransferase/glycosyltransferase involved in cell wall biosynthesis
MRRRQVLVCGPSIADPDRQSGSRRTADLIEFLLDDGWLVTFAGSDAGRERYVRALRQKGVRTVDGDNELIEELVSASQFDLALIVFWYTAERFLPMIRRSSPQTRVVVDSIDLHFLRATRGAFLDGGSGPLALSDGEGSMFVRELNTYSAADAVLAVSEKEATTIDDFLARPRHAITIPDCEEGDRSPLTFEERAGILFIGNFEHPPNVGAVEFLCEEIAPRISSTVLERHPIHVVGNALDDSVRRLCEQSPGVNPVGWVPSVHPYLHSARVSVVPLRYGAGTKRKLIQALRAGTPTVSTSVGVEGLGVTPGSEVLVADDARSFAASVERLVEDEALWSRVADAGRSLTEPAYGRATTHARFRDAVAEILEREPNVFAPSVPATATRERAPLPDPPRRAIPATEDITPGPREEAECLSDVLLSEEFPSYGPAPDEQADLDRAYGARVASLGQFFPDLAPDQPPSAPDRHELSDKMRTSIMRREWDERAKLNPMHYIASNKVVWDEEDFFSGGAGDVERYVGSDLEAICSGREVRAMRMLEIGCGIGRMTRHLAGIFGEVHGVDVAPTMVAVGREKMADRANIYLHETNGTDLGMFVDGFFDFAFSYIVFQHVPFREAVVSYFREVHRTLKPGCLFKFQVQGAAIERPNTWVGVGFTADEMQGHAQEIGFEPLREEGAGTQYYWHWWRRI